VKKRCTVCNELKPLSEFSPNPLGLLDANRTANNVQPLTNGNAAKTGPFVRQIECCAK
jgi:hypothetical protein